MVEGAQVQDLEHLYFCWHILYISFYDLVSWLDLLGQTIQGCL